MRTAGIPVRGRMVDTQCRAEANGGTQNSPRCSRRCAGRPRSLAAEGSVGILFKVVAAHCSREPTSSGSTGIPAQDLATQSALRPGSSVVERGPEKAGVGGSIPSLATITPLQPVSPGTNFWPDPSFLANQSTMLFHPGPWHLTANGGIDGGNSKNSERHTPMPLRD